MGRPFKYKPGDRVANGNVEILEVTSRGKGLRALVKIRCGLCGKDKVVASGHIHKMRSCGCMKHDSSVWVTTKAPNRPFQLPPGESAFNSLMYQYARSADQRGLKFELTRDEFRSLVTGPCFYCGSQCKSITKGLGKTSGDFIYTGVDRMRNEFGYTVSNSVSCCKLCNMMKHTLSVEEFKHHILAIANHIS